MLFRSDLRAKLEAMRPGTREQLVEEKRQALTPDERQILDTPQDKLTPEQAEKLYALQEKTTVTDREVAERIAKEQPDKEKPALQLAGELERENVRLRYTINYKTDSNYDYWYTRAKLEQSPNALAAREAMFKASRTFRAGDPFGAKKLYEDGFAKWRLVFDAFPQAIESESTTGDDLIQYILQYRNVLDQLDEELDDSFPLWDVIERFDNEQKLQDELAAHQKRLEAAKGEAPAEPNAAEK